MDVTTLVAGPAQAGAQPPVCKPGIGLAAGAGAAPAIDATAGDGFASLVAAALDQHDGDTSTSCPDTRGDGVEEDPSAEAGGDDTPLDAAADAATLSLLIALTTPVAAPASMPQPDVAEQGTSDPGVVEGDVASSVVTASTDATAMPAATWLAANAATPVFEDVLTSAADVADAPAAISAAAAPAASAPAPVAAAAIPETPAAPADAVAAGPQPANAAAPSTAPGAAAAAPPAASASRAGQRTAGHPLRQALAAMAATVPADTTSSTPATQPGATTAAPRTAAPVASAPAAAAVSASAHESRAAAVSRDGAGAAALTAAFAAASDAGSSGDGSPDGAAGGFAGAASWTQFRGAESRHDVPAAFLASTSGTADIATGATLASAGGPGTGFGAAGDTMLRAIDVPAAARFEQTLSSVDPDVRNLQAMVRTVRLFTGGGGAHEARLTLEPEHLGHVALTVRVEQGSVSAHFRAETPAAQRWIETHQQELRAGLREQGLEVKEVVVTTDPDGRRERHQDAQPARPPRTRRPQGADAPRFEVVV